MSHQNHYPKEVMMEDATEVSASAALGAALSDPGMVDNTPYTVVPDEYRVESLEHLLDSPTRARGKVAMRDLASFVAYVVAESTPATRLYGQVNPPMFTAVINDHSGVNPGWRDYRAVYTCPFSPEWRTWTGANGKHMSQEQFAQFIEDNLPDIATPPAAEMLEISRTLEAKKKVNFASGIRLSNGQNELTYEETVSGTAGKGKFVVPEEFTIGVPVLENGERYAVTARLRYRIGEAGKMSMWFELVRPHKIVEDASAALWKAIQEGTGRPIFNGSTE